MTEAGAITPVRVPQWTFGDRLRKVRRELGDTQTAFAARLGESSKTYSNWEADRHPPASIVAVAKRIELATGVPATWVLGLTEVPPAGPTSPGGGSTPNGQEVAAGSSRKDTEFLQRRSSQLAAAAACRRDGAVAFGADAGRSGLNDAA